MSTPETKANDMRMKILSAILGGALLAIGCTKTGSGSEANGLGASDKSGYSGTGSGGSGGGSGSGGGQSTPGVITAGEWNDLDRWSFWDSLMAKADYARHAPYWSFYNNNRIAVRLKDASGNPVTNAVVQLKKDGAVTFTARTDNYGKAELWADLFTGNANASLASYKLDVNNGALVANNVKGYAEGVNELTVPFAVVPAAKMEIAFVVDATGSMGDELSYLQTELKDVITRVHAAHPAVSILTSSVFYRDKGDEYVTRVSPFTADAQTTINFIKAQKAGGGGDLPEAVHSALEKATAELQWSADARTRILFLLLDAPPHHETDVIGSLQASIAKAAEKGIKVIPITASGIDKPTEFLMRFTALTTNGTYVFITNHSGVGGNHIEATVGPYQVEYLNNLMVRLIGKYVQ